MKFFAEQKYVFTPYDEVEEPYRSRAQKWFNVSKVAACTILVDAVALIVTINEDNISPLCDKIEAGVLIVSAIAMHVSQNKATSIEQESFRHIEN